MSCRAVVDNVQNGDVPETSDQSGGTSTVHINLQALPIRVRLRGGAESLAEDNTHEPVTEGDDAVAEPSDNGAEHSVTEASNDEVDSLYRVDFAPADVNGELSEASGDPTHVNGTAPDNLGSENPQHGVPANSLHEPDTHQNGSSDQGEMDHDLAESRVNGVQLEQPSSSRSAAVFHHFRVDSMWDTQQDEDEWVIDWWLWDPVERTGSTPSNHSNPIGPLYFWPFAQAADYNAFAGFDTQQQNSNATLFERTASMPQLVPPHEPRRRQSAPPVLPSTLLTAVPNQPESHMNDVGLDNAELANTNTVDGQAERTGRRERLLARLRQTRNNIRRLGTRLGRGLFKRH